VTPVSDTALDSLHAEAAEIFTGALEACNIESAFDRRLKFERNTVRRLIPDGSGPETINLSNYKRIFVIALGKAATPMLEVLMDCEASAVRSICRRSAAGASATSRAAIRYPMRSRLTRPARPWQC